MLVRDTSGHRYIVPVEHVDDWVALYDLDEDDEASWEVPEWAERIEGGRLTFKDWWVE
jgi:hypothetical protein